MYLDRDGVKIYYEVNGTGPATILLTHGYSGTLRMWDPQIEALAEHYQLVTWDLRGHGKSDSPEDVAQYSSDRAITDMCALLDAVNAPQAVIGGLSLGGYLSLAFHTLHAERTTALVLADTGPGYRNDVAREDWNKMARARGKFFRRKGLAGLPEGDPAHGDTHTSADGLAKAAEGTLVQHDGNVMASLPGIKVPTLVMVGADDSAFIKPSQYMAGKIPGARLEIIPGAGHVANIDQAQLFNDALVGFLATLA